tara:strand:- start:21684 stop:23957 length:2274 start_codon:yes stop_codon:yes gene_type:complete
MPKTSAADSKYNLRSKPTDSLKKKGDDDDNFPEDVEKLSPEEYQKLLAKLFPSKYMQDKVNKQDGEKKDTEEESDEEESDEEESDEEESEESSDEEDDRKTDKINIILTIGGAEQEDSDSDSDYETVSEDEDDYDDYDDYEEEESYEDYSKKELRSELRSRGIIYKGGSKKEMIELLEEDDEIPYEEYSKEDLRDTLKIRGIKCKKGAKEKEMIKLLEQNDAEEAVKEVNSMFNKKRPSSAKSYKKSGRGHADAADAANAANAADAADADAADALLEMKHGKKESLSDNHVLKQFKELAEKLTGQDRKNKLLGKAKTHIECMEKEVEREKKRREKKEKEKNCKTFKKMMKGKTFMDDKKYFEKMELEQQKKVIEEFEKVNDNYNQTVPYRFQVLQSTIPHMHKYSAIKKINTLRYMTPGEGEYYKLKYWVDGFMRIPFGESKNLPLVIEDGIDKTHEFMFQAKQILDDAVYGLDDAKMQIMQMIGQLITNPKSVGTAIAIKGPMGTGKTTLVREGISKILQRPFAFIALGGATDSSFLEGHSYTYEGSSWGKIVDILMQSKCMNPVFFFDELDKVSDTPKGEEIIGILTHLTDTSQNTQFHDKYFSELDFDLSKALFIFSYNDESRVNPILRDRMYRIQTQGYETKDKQIITKQYMEPKIYESVKMNKGDVVIEDDTIKHIIEKYTDEEKGVRNLKRCLEIIYTKLNLYRLMKPNSQLFKEEKSLEVQFPFTVTTEIVDKLIKSTDKVEKTYLNFYI